MEKTRRLNVVAGSATAVTLALAIGGGAYWSGARASARDLSPVSAVTVGPATAPPSFANLIQHVAPAVVSIDVTRRASRQDVQFSGAGDGAQTSPFPFVFGAPGRDGSGDDDHSQNDPQVLPGFPGFPFQNMRPGSPDGQELPVERATGSGFFISPDGYIVTNNHVVEGATSITVRLADKRQFKARLVGRDPATDLAVVKVDGQGFSFVSFQDKAKPRVGDWVVAVGNPYDLGGTATAGIVSALGRQNISGSSFVDYMQIDAPINRGNSGGPAFDVYGRVVGVNAAIYSPSGGSVGIGFAIPADVAESVTRQLMAHGKVERGYIGATIQNVGPDIAASLGIKADQGALVADLTPDGPAARAGVKVGDVIVGVDGQPIGSASALTQRIALVRAGEQVRLQVLRDGQPMTLNLRSGRRPAEAQLASNALGNGQGEGEQGGSGAAVLGMRLGPLNDQTRQQFAIARQGGGAVVEEVSPNTDAQNEGLQAGDVIVRAGSRPVAAPSDVTAATADAKRSGRADVLLLVSRNGQTIFIPVKVTTAAG